MENKKKINISTILLVFAIIIIVVLGFFLYKTNNEKKSANEKVAELENDISAMNNVVDTLQGNINSISNTINGDTTKDKEQQTSTETTKSTATNDNSSYIGKWSDNNSNEFTIKNIGNGYITFTWFIYRLASADDVTIPINNNKAEFYYSGTDDKNFNGQTESDEYYYRKATLELKNNKINITVEDIPHEEFSEHLDLDKSDIFNGNVYVNAGEYTFSTKQ